MESGKVELTALRCLGCGAALTIVDNYLCECEYCGGRYIVSNLPEIIQAVREERRPPVADYFYAGSVLDEPYHPYFVNWDRLCDKCVYLRYSGYQWKQEWCKLHRVFVELDMTCEAFRAE